MTITLTTRRAFVAGLFVAPAIIPAGRLMRVTSIPLDFWVRYFAGDHLSDGSWQSGITTFKMFKIYQPFLRATYGGEPTWEVIPTPPKAYPPSHSHAWGVS